MVEIFGWIISLLAIFYLYFRNASESNKEEELPEELVNHLKKVVHQKKEKSRAQQGLVKKKKLIETAIIPPKFVQKPLIIKPVVDKDYEPPNFSKIQKLLKSSNLQEIIILKELLDTPKGLKND